jgi:hypothetical protein
VHIAHAGQERPPPFMRRGHLVSNTPCTGTRTRTRTRVVAAGAYCPSRPRAAASFYAPRTPRLEYAVYLLGISNVPCSVAFGIFMDGTSTARRRLSTSSWSTPLHHHSTVCTSSHLTEAIPCVPSRGCTHCRDTGLHVPSLSLLTLLPVGQLPGRQANRAVNFSLPRTVVVGFSSPPSIETPYFFKKNEYSIIYIFK